MRLTLRTLMAWLDDTLPPKDVRRIGRQLERSKFSQDLSRRIQKVIRQRRLTVPGMGTSQPVDANIVAAYLDNNLSPDQTTIYESLCLNSDVHLAEVAASHQILSVLDQSARISPESFAVMYRLVKAPEARMHSDRPLPASVPTDETREGIAAFDASDDDDGDWPAPDFQRNLPRFVAACATLGLLMAFGNLALYRLSGPETSALRNRAAIPVDVAIDDLTGPDASAEFPPPADAANAPPAEPAAEELAVKPDMPVETKTASKEVAVVAPSAETAAPLPADTVKPPAVTIDEPKKKADAAPVVSANFDLPKVAESADLTILLTSPKADGGPGTWVRVTKDSKATQGRVRFAGAESTRLDLGGLTLTIEPGTLLEFEADEPPNFLSGQANAITSRDGEFLFRFDNAVIAIRFPAEARFSLARLRTSAMGSSFQRADLPETLEIQAIGGDLSVRVGRTEYTLPQGQIGRVATGETPSPLLKVEEADQAGASPPATRPEDPGSALVTRMMMRYLTANRPLPTAVIDAESDELAGVRDLAMKIALWIDRDDIVAGVLTDLENPELRESAVRALRTSASLGDAGVSRTSKAVIEELELNDADASLFESMLATPAATADFMRKRQLVAALEHNSRLMRQLALEHLMKIAGRDSMGFDPDNPTQKGLEAWRTWLGMDVQDRRP